MRYMTKRWLTAAVTAVALASLLVAIVTMRARTTPEPPRVNLQTASTAALASNGIQLTEPVGSPQIDQAAASTAAVAEYPGSTVREAVLARVDDKNSASPVHCLCWVVSIKPSEGFYFPSAGPANRKATTAAPTYMILIIDAATGRFLEGTAGE
jgi:hypothetical protein